MKIAGLIFTDREIDVISCILNMRGIKKIAEILSISPRTIETHIRNILFKIGANSQEAIIDFVEESPEFKSIKEHYLYLLERSVFENQLKRISNLASKYKTFCYINFNNKNPILQSIILHITLAGIKVLPISSVDGDGDTKTIDLKYNCKLQLLFSHNVDQLFKDKQEKIKLGTIFLNIDRTLTNFKVTQPFTEEMIDFSVKEQYFTNIFRILEKLLVNIDCSKFIPNFEYLKNNIINSKINISPELVSSNKNHKNLNEYISSSRSSRLLILLTTFVGIIIVVFLLFYTTRNSNESRISSKNNKILDTIKSSEQSIKEKNNFFPYLNSFLKEERIKYFIGREEEFSRLEKILQEEQLVLITGIPGVGKSSFVLEYGYKTKNKGYTVRWFDCISEDKIYREYIKIAQELMINTVGINREVLLNIVNLHIEALNSKIIFIFDNVNRYEDIKEYILKLPQNVQILITSTNIKLIPKLITENQHIKLKTFKVEEAILYLQTTLDKRVSINDIDKLVSTTGTIPRKLSQIINYFYNNSLETVDSYLKRREMYTSNHPETDILLNTFIMNKDMKLHWELLQYICYLDPDFVNIEILEKLLKLERKKLQNILNFLMSLSLIDVIYKGNNIGIKIHRETQIEIQRYREEWQNASIPEEKLYKCLLKVLDELMPFITFIPDENWVVSSMLKDNVETALNRSQNLAYEVSSNLSLKLAAYYEHVACNFNMSIKYKELALIIQQKLYKGNAPNIAETLRQIGVTYYRHWDKNNIIKGLEYSQKALAMMQALYKNDHPAVALSLDNLGCAYIRLGGEDNIKKGLKYKNKSLQLREELYKANHFDIVLSLNNIGWGYQRLRTREAFVKALQYQKRAIKMVNELFPNNPHRAAFILHNTGFSYIGLGSLEDLKEGLKYSELALALRLNLYKGYHIDLANSIKNVGEIYEKLGDPKKGIEYKKNAYLMSKNSSGSFHNITQELEKFLSIHNPEFLQNKEERMLILEYGSCDESTIFIKEKLQRKVLNRIQKLASKGYWGKTLMFYDNGVKQYVQEKYLCEVLGESCTKENLKISKMLSFEAINIGVMSKPKRVRNHSCIIEFIKENSELVKEIAYSHPEYFIDGSILAICKKYIQDLKLIQNLKLIH